MHKNSFSQFVGVFQDRALPEPRMRLAGYAALINQYSLRVPLPDSLCVISQKHRRYQKDIWKVFTPRHAPAPHFFSHLIFALKYEGVDLHIIDALFDQVSVKELARHIKYEPTGIYRRKIWFLYEWLKEKTLAVPDLTMGNLAPVIDEELQFAGPVRVSKRHRIKK